MKVTLDAYAVIAALLGERARVEVQPLIESAAICAPNLAEVLDVCVRAHGNDEPTVRERLGWLITGGLDVVPLDSGLALAAGSLRARHYHRQRCAISLGDCCALALAKHRGWSLATADPDLARTARCESVDVVALPDSRGKRP